MMIERAERRGRARLGVTIAFAIALFAAAGCAVGPRYRVPETPTPAVFKEAGDWVPAQPHDQVPRGPWWTAFGDSVLDRLESQVEVSSQTLAAAEAQYRQALALAGIAYSGQFPSVGLDASGARVQSPAKSGTVEPPPVNTVAAGLTAAWELDLWGRLRRTAEAGRASAQASAADLESARLSLHALLAQTYFSLRTVDHDRSIIDRLSRGYEQSLQITQNQYDVGVAARSDIDAATAQLKQAQAEGIDLEVQRAQLEHALAVLMGRFPSTFSLTPAESTATLPTPPAILPTQLLERRPDVAAAERRLAASSASIGVAASGYFPNVTLSGSGGYQAPQTTNLFTAPYQVWALGAALTQTIFDAGRTRATVAGARAAYDQDLADYRETVLEAFQDVEDNLAAIHILEREQGVQTEATDAAQQSLERTLNQYRAGTVNHVNVLNAQAALFVAERAGSDLAGRRYQAAVALYKATGGDWIVPSGAPPPARQ